jgi:tripartite-type tricarboxylate transporter receptor subunit TctC
MASRVFGWRRALATALVLFASLASPASAQDTYPSRPIKLVSPVSARRAHRSPGARDRGAALRGTQGARRRRQQAGAGTLVGAEFVAKQPPDGYTLLMATSTTLGISPGALSAVADQSGARFHADRAESDRSTFF